MVCGSKHVCLRMSNDDGEIEAYFYYARMSDDGVETEADYEERTKNFRLSCLFFCTGIGW